MCAQCTRFSVLTVSCSLITRGLRCQSKPHRWATREPQRRTAQRGRHCTQRCCPRRQSAAPRCRRRSAKPKHGLQPRYSIQQQQQQSATALGERWGMIQQGICGGAIREAQARAKAAADQSTLSTPADITGTQGTGTPASEPHVPAQCQEAGAERAVGASLGPVSPQGLAPQQQGSPAIATALSTLQLSSPPQCDVATVQGADTHCASGSATAPMASPELPCQQHLQAQSPQSHQPPQPPQPQPSQPPPILTWWQQALQRTKLPAPGDTNALPVFDLSQAPIMPGDAVHLGHNTTVVACPHCQVGLTVLRPFYRIFYGTC